jgi:hypothetical protein
MIADGVGARTTMLPLVSPVKTIRQPQVRQIVG